MCIKGQIEANTQQIIFQSPCVLEQYNSTNISTYIVVQIPFMHQHYISFQTHEAITSFYNKILNKYM